MILCHVDVKRLLAGQTLQDVTEKFDELNLDTSLIPTRYQGSLVREIDVVFEAVFALCHRLAGSLDRRLVRTDGPDIRCWRINQVIGIEGVDTIDVRYNVNTREWTLSPDYPYLRDLLDSIETNYDMYVPAASALKGANNLIKWAAGINVYDKLWALPAYTSTSKERVAAFLALANWAAPSLYWSANVTLEKSSGQFKKLITEKINNEFKYLRLLKDRVAKGRGTPKGTLLSELKWQYTTCQQLTEGWGPGTDEGTVQAWSLTMSGVGALLSKHRA